MIGGHGGNVYDLARSLGCSIHEIIDMSSNVNPMGPMPELVEHLKTRLDCMALLPEVDSGRIIRSFARYHGLSADLVLAGNGSTQFIYTLPLALNLKRVLIVGPTYADYFDACRVHGTEVRHLMATAAHAFTPDPGAIGRTAKGMDAVFLCNPNNPTGALIDKEAIKGLCRNIPGTLFIVDESYLPFVEGGEEKSLLAWKQPNLVVISSMSKIFRIPGLRIGFIKAQKSIVDKLNRYMLPWSVNSLAQAAVDYLMHNIAQVDAFLARTRAFLGSQRAMLSDRINAIPGLTCYPSRTSFLLIRLDSGLRADKIWAGLAAKKILIRDCTNFRGLGLDFIRISLKGEAENHLMAKRLERLSHARQPDAASSGAADGP
jgi:threonine-phosphate decarboxylase